jgi:CheY-like chemotaxis protein
LLTEDYGASDAIVWAEPMRVQQIIYNLLSNAVKFSPWSAPIALRTRNPEPGWIELEVVDHGEGIAPEFLPRLFQPFTQGAPHRHPNSGLGLGLALSRQLAELYGGTISTVSAGLGRGAVFTLRLPTARAAQTVPEATPRVGVETSGASVDGAVGAHVASNADDSAIALASRPLRILVIEDDLSAARALRRMLTLEGHVVHLAASLATAEQIAFSEPLDVVIADLQLGAESGLAAPRRVAEAARRNGHAVPAAIVLSGYDRDSDLAQTTAAGFVEHLAKPVDGHALLVAVQRAADNEKRDGAQ